MAEVQFEIDLNAELGDQFGEWTRKFEAEMRAALDQIAHELEASARDHAPSRTGRLRRSITSRVEGSTVIVESDLDYAAAVEEGWQQPAIVEAERPILQHRRPGRGARRTGRGQFSKDRRKPIYMEKEGGVYSAHVRARGAGGQHYFAAALDAMRAKIPAIVRSHLP